MFHSFSPNYFLVHLQNKALFLPQGLKEGKIFLRTIYCKRMISVPTVCLILRKKECMIWFFANKMWLFITCLFARNQNMQYFFLRIRHALGIKIILLQYIIRKKIFKKFLTSSLLWCSLGKNGKEIEGVAIFLCDSKKKNLKTNFVEQWSA